MFKSKAPAFLLVAVLIAALTLTGCAGNQSTNTGSSGSSQPSAQNPVNLKAAFPSAVGLSDIGSLVTFDNMKKDGYNVKSTFMTTNDLAVQAVVSGQADFGVCASATVIAAAQAGSPLEIFGQRTKNQWVLVTKSDITTVQDLVGKRYAIHATSSLTAAVTKWLEKKDNIKLNPLIVPGADVRMQALLNHQIDATPLDLTTWETLNKQAPGKFHILVNFMQEIPGLDDLSYFSTKSWVQSHQDAVMELLKTEITTYRAAKADPNTFYSAIPTYFPDDNKADDQAALEPLITKGVYDVNAGGVDFGNQTWQFYLDANWLSGDTSKLKASDFFDNTYLVKVLKQLGTQ